MGPASPPGIGAVRSRTAPHVGSDFDISITALSYARITSVLVMMPTSLPDSSDTTGSRPTPWFVIVSSAVSRESSEWATRRFWVITSFTGVLPICSRGIR